MSAIDPNLEWIGHVQPVGLVVAPAVLARHGLVPEEQTRADSEAVKELLADEKQSRALADPWAFLSRILDWRPAQVAGAPGGPPLPNDLTALVAESDTVLRPTYAVAAPGGGWQILVRIEAPGIGPDERGALEGWEATPHQRLERLARETGVATGLLVTDAELRLVHAPRGETSGWLAFPLRALGGVAGRPMLGGLKLLLGSFRLHNDASERRLPALLKASRDAQAEVSGKLAGQVLGALHELLRGLHAADRARIETLARDQPGHLYEGLLTVLLRLVFLLYAEDRDLIPSRSDAEARALYEEGYGVRALHARLLGDQARNPDTMDERRGAWARLLALFRLVHRGDATGWIRGRGGKLFDPAAFPFLQGQDEAGDRLAPAPVSDGCVLRVLDGLLTLGGERLSYRTLDVEQIGSVYETVMGFTVVTLPGPALAIRAGQGDRTPVFVDLAALAAVKKAERPKFLKETADRGKVPDRVGRPLGQAADIAALAEALRPIVDERGSPGGVVALPGTPLLQPTDERRRTGSHYTPRSLTEPIVRHALEPAFERIGDDSGPEAVLALKVCDPACGSGAFLVEACRQLGERLVRAWSHWPDTRPAIPPDEDEALHARRLVAQRCLYGVDKNPLAADLARLSLWLATLARDHEFTFLDHAVKAGDSLVGLSARGIAAAHWSPSKPGLTLFRRLVEERVAEATRGRAEIREAPDDTLRAVQEARHRTLEERLAPMRLMGDAVVAAFFSADKPRAREHARVAVERLITDGMEANWDGLRAVATQLREGAHPLKPFHWNLEFPEVFAGGNPGFDAIVGNPPFAGKNTLINGSRAGTLPWLQTLHEGAHGNADLVAHFFRRAYGLLKDGGVLGLIATNTIGQGDTRDTGLAAILGEGGTIRRATRRVKWPGEAAVVVSVVHVAKGPARSPVLDGRQVRRISAYVVEGELDRSPVRLAANARKAFVGTYVLGMGFTFDDAAADKGEAESLDAMRALIARDPRNAERIRPYIGGEEVNTSPAHAHHRYVIDFADFPLRRDPVLPGWAEAGEARRETWLRGGVVPSDYPGPVAADWPDLLEIVERRVKPARLAQGREARAKRWWRFGDRQPGLYATIAPLDRVLAIPCGATPHVGFGRLPVGSVYAHTIAIFALSTLASFAALQSRVHEVWTRFFASTLEDRLRYTPSDCFETFPFSASHETSALEVTGCAYHDHRAALMVARNEGLTKIYNRFHDSTECAVDIRALRDLHAAMDRAVLEAYGWSDLAARAEPIFLDQTNEGSHAYQGRLFWPSDFRDEVLSRLLALNAERHAEEVRLGLASATAIWTAGDDAEDGLDRQAAE